MRIMKSSLAFAVLFLTTLFIIHPGHARAEVNIAVVDVDILLSQSKAAKSIQNQVEQKRKSFLSSVKKAEDSLRAEQKSIEEKRNDISKEQLVKKAQEFEKRRLEARKKIQTKKQDLDKAYSQAMNTLNKVIFDVCQKLADERSIDLVITRQNIVVGNMSLDITKDVLAAIDKKLPNITLQTE